MSIEIIGTFTHRDSSEARPRPMGEIDPAFIRELAQAFETAGFDRVLIAKAATWPDGLIFASHLSAWTQRLRFMVAHRPGVMAPSFAARALATLDRMSADAQGRVQVHVISAPSDIETQADGDFLTKAERHRRSGEYIELLRRMWQGETFDHDGDFYRLRGAHSTVVPAAGQIPVSFGGTSPEALAIAGAHADIYAFGIEPLERSAALIGAVQEQAARHGRNPDFCLSTRIILGQSEAQAWARADEVLADVTGAVAAMAQQGQMIGDLGPSARLAEMAARGLIQDSCLWTGIAHATGFRKAASALVGTVETVVEALMAYHALGVRRFLISGFDPLADVRAFGQELIPALRERAATA
ncbi:MAG TPA: LLM class flavin-dependent oxidoreductase [Novosphingobium sp.]|nr:LLM class flavin-dependent oxidoreductase [Novosphingobium sp.]